MVVFPGNPGTEYKKTRHNAARLFLKYIEHGTEQPVKWKHKFNAQEGYITAGNNNRVILLKPEVFMNNTGKSVAAAVNFYKVPKDGFLVVHDDMETPFGSISVKRGGGLGGHNGLKSIKNSLGHQDFYKLKIGIGRPDKNISPSDWVLGRFSEFEESVLPDIFNAASNVLYNLLDTDKPEETGKITVLEF